MMVQSLPRAQLGAHAYQLSPTAQLQVLPRHFAASRHRAETSTQHDWACSGSSSGAPSSSSSSSTRSGRLQRCMAAPSLKTAVAGQVEPAYLEGATYLKTLGFTNTADIARILDIAMNPDSLFLQYSDNKRSQNSLARSLSVEEDMQPVVEYLRSQGLDTPQVVQVISVHPAVLCYSVPERLQPFWEYMTSIGVPDVAAAVVERPSLLGLDVDNSLRKIVDYLQYVETPPDKIVAYITKSI